MARRTRSRRTRSRRTRNRRTKRSRTRSRRTKRRRTRRRRGGKYGFDPAFLAKCRSECKQGRLSSKCKMSGWCNTRGKYVLY